MAIIASPKMAWICGAFVFVILTISLYRNNSKNQNVGKWKAFFGRISWISVILFVMALAFAYKGSVVSNPIAKATNTGYAEISLPWQMTIDVINGTIKNYPWFGVGPNHFAQALSVYKPAGLNASSAWSIEFNSGFGYIPTFIVTQGGIGALLWILFLVFTGILSVRLLSKLPENGEEMFIYLSSCLLTVFSVLYLVFYTPSHSVIFLTFVFLGIFLANIILGKYTNALTISPKTSFGRKYIFGLVIVVCILIAVILAVIYTKKFIAFNNFAKGVKAINLNQDFEKADTAFRKAVSLDESDFYWQAISENNRLRINQIVATATSSSPEIVKQLGSLIEDGINSSRNAIKYDPSNYYNYLSEARLSDIAASIKMANAYENAVKAYTSAIQLNPFNPLLYLSLAQSQANNGKFDDAIATIGSALQVKNNYLEAVYLLSQIQANQGKLNDAIISTQFAIQLNSSSPLLYFQLGLLYYNAQNYGSSIQAFEQAIKLAPDYANAKYFLGLSYVRQNRNEDAVALFMELSETNPDNQEVAFILNNLRAGRSPFADAKPPVTSSPEKRSKLPLNERE